nr:RNA polymerase sigma factor [Alteromonas ponticola]
MELDKLYRSDSRKIFATLVRLLGDFDLAEEALHDAFLAASKTWLTEGIPSQPVNWLISAGRFKSIDRIRKDKTAQRLLRQDPSKTESEEFNEDQYDEYLDDDVLKLIFTCCHPAVNPEIQIALTLREVCGLKTENIAQAFLVSTTTMAQRIVRGKGKIRHSAIPFELPAKNELNQRLDAVLLVIYLIYNEGYLATSGTSLLRIDLSNEAIRLATLLSELIDDSEVNGLLALLLFQDARKAARVDSAGNSILLENQDRSLWNAKQVQTGVHYLNRAFEGSYGVYTLQAAIAHEHVRAKEYTSTNWAAIEAFYRNIISIEPTAIFRLNHAVALSMVDGPESGLQQINALLLSNELKDYTFLYCAQGEMLYRQKRYTDALNAFSYAHSLTNQAAALQSIKCRMDEIKQHIR